MSNDGSGNFSQEINYPVGDGPVAAEVPDFDLDGDPDIITCDHGGDDISLLLNQGNGSFDPAQSHSLAPRKPMNFVFGDFDCD